MRIIDRVQAWRYARKLGYHLPAEKLFAKLYDPKGSRGVGYARGGEITGPRKPGEDEIPIRLSDPHAWMTRKDYEHISQKAIDAINGQHTVVHIVDDEDQGEA